MLLLDRLLLFQTELNFLDFGCLRRLFKANISTHYSLFSGSKQEYQTRKQDL